MGGRGGNSRVGGGGGGGGGGGAGGPPATGKDAERFNRQGEALPTKLRRALETRFAKGTDVGKELYDMLIPNGGAVKDTHTAKAYYTDLERAIYMHFLMDMRNPRGAGSTWFHEHGHYVDFGIFHLLGKSFSTDQTFVSALRNDVLDYEMHYAAARPDMLRQFGSADKAVAEYLKLVGHATSGVQDVFGGIHRDRSNYYWGHDNDYWTSDWDVAKEAAAHMFEAQFSEQKARYMQEFLPTAWKRYNDLLEKYTERLRARGVKAR